MPQDQAVKVLTQLCVPPLSQEAALALWENYRKRVAALPPRACCIPERIKLSLSEKQEIVRFRKQRRGDRTIRAVIKIDPVGLVVHQFIIIRNCVDSHLPTMNSKKASARTCLGLDMTPLPPRILQSGTTTIIKLPHFEYVLQPAPGGKILVLEAGNKNITGAEFAGRMLLWTGYHRTYGACSQMTPEARDTAPLVTLIAGAPEVDRLLGINSEAPEVRDAARGDRPALFGDFFDATLCMTATLRRQRMEFHIDNNDIRTARRVFVDVC